MANVRFWYGILDFFNYIFSSYNHTTITELDLFPSSCRNKNYETDFLGTPHNLTQKSRLHLLSFLPDNVNRLSYRKMYAFNRNRMMEKASCMCECTLGSCLKSETTVHNSTK